MRAARRALWPPHRPGAGPPGIRSRRALPGRNRARVPRRTVRRDGHAPTLHRYGRAAQAASLEPPAFAQSAKPEFVAATRRTLEDIVRLLVRCGVKARGATIREYPTRHAASSYPAAQD